MGCSVDSMGRVSGRVLWDGSIRLYEFLWDRYGMGCSIRGFSCYHGRTRAARRRVNVIWRLVVLCLGLGHFALGADVQVATVTVSLRGTPRIEIRREYRQSFNTSYL